jgi:hypothetical protein
MPSPTPCSGSPGEPGRSPTVRHCTFPRQPPDLPVRVTEGVSGVPVPCRVAPPHWPYIRFLFVGSPFCRRLPPHPASLRRSCLWLAVPLLAARRGLAPPSSVSCVAHMGPGLRRDDKIGLIALSGQPRVDLYVNCVLKPLAGSPIRGCHACRKVLGRKAGEVCVLVCRELCGLGGDRARYGLLHDGSSG